MSDYLRRPYLSGNFCQVPNQIARMPVAAGERVAKELLLLRLSLPDRLEVDFLGHAHSYLSTPRNSYYKALQILVDWGFLRRLGKADYEWTLDVDWNENGRPKPLGSTRNGYNVVPKTGTTGEVGSTRNGYNVVPETGTTADPIPSYRNNTKNTNRLVSRSVPPSDAKDGKARVVEEGDCGEPAVAGWDPEAAEYERGYAEATAGLPPSKLSGGMTPKERRQFDGLMESGVPVEDLLAAVRGMALEARAGNAFRTSESSVGGFWHVLVFREGNRVKYADMWRRQSVVQESTADSESQLRRKFGRLGQ